MSLETLVAKITSDNATERRDAWIIAEQVGAPALSAMARVMAKKDRYTYYNMAHKEDWLLAIKTGRRPCVDLEAAHNVATLNNLGNLSFILDRKPNWDGKNERFVGDDYANRHLDRP